MHGLATGSHPGRADAWGRVRAGGETLLVPLPTLEGLVDAVQQQLRLQHARTQTSDVLGLEYGKLGQLLFTYDFLDAAEPAFRNPGPAERVPG